MFDVVSMGDILIDFVPCGKDADGDNMFARKAGGATFNFCATVSVLGGKAAYMGKVGNDIFGHFLKRTLNELGIEDRLVVDNDRNTTLAFVELNDEGDRDFSFYRKHESDLKLAPCDVDEKLLESTRCFHFGSLSLIANPAREATEKAISLAKKNGCIISYDPNYRPSLWENEEDAIKYMSYQLENVDVIKASVEELALISGKQSIDDGIEFAFSKGIKIVLVTDGANGSICAVKNEKTHIPAYKAKTIDTTGAGDIFFGTFMLELIKSGKALSEITFEDVKKFATKASYVSGLSTEKHGAVASIPRNL